MRCSSIDLGRNRLVEKLEIAMSIFSRPLNRCDFRDLSTELGSVNDTSGSSRESSGAWRKSRSNFYLGTNKSNPVIFEN